MGLPQRAGSNNWFRPGLYRQPHRLRNVSDGGGAAAFDPIDLSPTIWLEQDSVSTSAGLIDQFTDKSGNGHHFTSTLTARATLTTGINGQNTAQFDGSSDWYTCSSGQILSETTAHTIVLVAKHRGYDGAGDFDVVLNLKANTNRCHQVWITNQASYSEVAFGYANAGGTANQVVRATPTLGTTDHNCIIITYNGSGDETTTNYNFEKNGSGVTVNTAANATATYANELGRWSSTGLFAKIDFDLLIVIEGTSISAANRALLETWITNKYGITF